jgi:hypothetical protein
MFNPPFIVILHHERHWKNQVVNLVLSQSPKYLFKNKSTT